MSTMSWVTATQIASAVVVIALHCYGRFLFHRTQERIHAHLVQIADHAPTLEHMAIALGTGDQAPGDHQSLLEQANLIAVPDLQEATAEALHRLQKRPLQPALVAATQPPRHGKPAVSLPPALWWMMLAIAGAGLVFLGPKAAIALRHGDNSWWLGTLVILTPCAAAAGAADLRRKNRLLLMWRTEVATTCARLVTDHLLTPLYRQQTLVACQEVMDLIDPLTKQVAGLSAALAREVREPIARLREQMGQLSNHVQTLLTAAEVCTESLEALERLPEGVAEMLGRNACDQLASRAKEQRVQQMQATPFLLQRLAQITSQFSATDLGRFCTTPHAHRALEEMLGLVRDEGAQALFRVTGERLCSTLAWARDVEHATANLMKCLSELIEATEQSKRYAYEAWTLPERLEQEVTRLLQ